jgi:hypothetical protein
MNSEAFKNSKLCFEEFYNKYQNALDTLPSIDHLLKCSKSKTHLDYIFFDQFIKAVALFRPIRPEVEKVLNYIFMGVCKVDTYEKTRLAYAQKLLKSNVQTNKMARAIHDFGYKVAEADFMEKRQQTQTAPLKRTVNAKLILKARHNRSWQEHNLIQKIKDSPTWFCSMFLWPPLREDLAGTTHTPYISTCVRNYFPNAEITEKRNFLLPSETAFAGTELQTMYTEFTSQAPLLKNLQDLLRKRYFPCIKHMEQFPGWLAADLPDVIMPLEILNVQVSKSKKSFLFPPVDANTKLFYVLASFKQALFLYKTPFNKKPETLKTKKSRVRECDQEPLCVEYTKFLKKHAALKNICEEIKSRMINRRNCDVNLETVRYFFYADILTLVQQKPLEVCIQDIDIQQLSFESYIENFIFQPYINPNWLVAKPSQPYPSCAF